MKIEAKEERNKRTPMLPAVFMVVAVLVEPGEEPLLLLPDASLEVLRMPPWTFAGTVVSSVFDAAFLKEASV